MQCTILLRRTGRLAQYTDVYQNKFKDFGASDSALAFNSLRLQYVVKMRIIMDVWSCALERGLPYESPGSRHTFKLLMCDKK